MAGHLPVEWENKHLGVRFGSDRVITREGTMEAQNEGGVFIRTPDAEQPAFIPWSDILYVQLLEELEEPGESEAMIGRDGNPRDIAGASELSKGPRALARSQGGAPHLPA